MDLWDVYRWWFVGMHLLIPEAAEMWAVVIGVLPEAKMWSVVIIGVALLGLMILMATYGVDK